MTDPSLQPAKPPPGPARLIALLILLIVALLGAIIEESFSDDLGASICMAIAIVLFLALGYVIARLILAGGSSVLFSVGRTIWGITSAAIWTLVIAAILIVIIALCASGSGAAFPALLYFIAFVGMLLMTWSSAQAAIRRRRVLLILNTLSSAVRLGVPLSKSLQDAAQGETGVMQKRLLAIHAGLQRGESLADAILRGVPEVPRGDTRAIGAGERTGCLEHVLDTLIHQSIADESIAQRGPRFYWVYPGMIAGVVGLLLICVIPKFEGIFHDFHLTLPLATRILVSLADQFQFLWIAVVLLTLMPLGKALSRIAPITRIDLPLWESFKDHLAWWTPLLGSYIRDRGMAQLCDFVAVTAELGRPLDESLFEAAAAQDNAVMRHRAGRWAALVAQGQPMHEAARRARLPQLFPSMLATVRGGQSFQQVLYFLWRHYEYRVDRMRTVLVSLYTPAMVLTLGAVVGFVAVAMFTPLAMLANSLGGAIPTGGF